MKATRGEYGELLVGSFTGRRTAWWCCTISKEKKGPRVTFKATLHLNIYTRILSCFQKKKRTTIPIWKYAGFPANQKGTEEVGKCQPHMVKNDQSSESSGNSNLANRAVKTQEAQHWNTKDNTTDSFFPSISHYASTFSTRENAWLGANDSCSLPRGKQKSSSPEGRKPSGLRKFQYHPMEPSHGTNLLANSQSIPRQVCQGLKGLDQGDGSHPNFPNHAARDSIEINQKAFSYIQKYQRGK